MNIKTNEDHTSCNDQEFTETNERSSHGDSPDGDSPGRSFPVPRQGGGRGRGLGTGSSTSNVSSRASSNEHANSLIQSAARSVLEGKSPISIPLSDDGSEYASTASTKPVPTLESLETMPIPPMPDEQDRKRFVVRECSSLYRISFLLVLRHLLNFQSGMPCCCPGFGL